MNSRMLLLSIVVLTCMLPRVYAQAPPTIGLYSDPDATNMYLTPDSLYTVYPIYVVVLNAPYISGVEFSAPIPPCAPGIVCIGNDCPFPLWIGDSQQGISIAFGTCVTSPVHVLTINTFPLELNTSDCYYPVLPAPFTASGKIELVDCNNNIFYGIGLTSIFSYNYPPGIMLVYPMDGAVERPMDQQLHWIVEDYSHGQGEIYTDVYFGTEEDPPIVAHNLQTNTYDPGLLQPETTYYWKLYVVDTASPEATTSPIWSFTTESAVPIERNTWGSIKALYD